MAAAGSGRVSKAGHAGRAAGELHGLLRLRRLWLFRADKLRRLSDTSAAGLSGAEAECCYFVLFMVR